MGGLRIAPPGSWAGPCETPCAHTDCAETRTLAAEVCSLCDGPIGYDTPFYRVGERYEHAVCAWSAEEQRRDQRRIADERLRAEESGHDFDPALVGCPDER